MKENNDFFHIPEVKPVIVGGQTLDDNKMFLIAGPCAIESRDIILEIADSVKTIASKFAIPYIFKASYDKANRTSLDSYRGPGLQDGIRSLKYLKETLGVDLLTDVHETSHVKTAADIADCLQIPAFLCRQTDLLLACGASMKAVNIKKGQFMSPGQMTHAVRKVESTGNRNIILTERGASFGYGNLVVDMRAIYLMRKTGYPVVFDATHSVQLPGAQGESSGGERDFIFTLSKAAIAAGASGLFIETHPFPPSALSDGPNMVPLDKLEELIERLLPVYESVRK
jgi:2-dehydro-3-deoxyphosphooctonate aldolase (KDO 8-P synthase)